VKAEFHLKNSSKPKAAHLIIIFSFCNAASHMAKLGSEQVLKEPQGLNGPMYIISNIELEIYNKKLEINNGV
jgi:hypothetical protein